MSSQLGTKVLWVNPSFLDYRIPLYEELNKCLDGHFHLIYSRNRVPERCHTKLNSKLGDNAHPLESERIISVGNSASDFANSSVNIPLPRGLYKAIKKVKPDLIIAEGFFQFTPWAVLFSFIHSIPLLIAYERTAHTERNCPKWRLLYRKFIGKFVNGYLANGSLTKSFLVSQGVAEKKIQTGCMCADSSSIKQKINTFTNNEYSDLKFSTLHVPHNGLLYLCVCRLIDLKGVNYLIDNWKEHIIKYPDDRLVIIGDGPNLNKYKTLYSLPSVIFTGAVDYDDIYQYYAIADVFVIPTLEDNWSLVVPEAMACGLPVACSIYNGCYPELVHKDVNGLTFDPLDSSSVLNALSYFHNADLKKMGEASIKIESEYTPEKVAQNILRAVRQELSKSK